jgi:hypothetical protein
MNGALALIETQRSIFRAAPRKAPLRGRPRSRSDTGACSRTQDLWAASGRSAIGQALVGWLRRHRVTPFELLHRPDLVDRLMTSEAELSAALYTAALAEAAARGAPLEPVRRHLDALVQRAFERVDSDEPDVAFRLGVAVARELGRHANWKAKLEALLALFEAAPVRGEAARVSHRVLIQPLADMLGGQGDLDEILGFDLALGEQLMVLMQVASAPALAAVSAGEGGLGRLAPRLKGLALSLALLLHGGASFAPVRRAIVARVLERVGAGERLWPDDAAREVDGAAALSMLLGLSGRLVDDGAIARAFAGRWRSLAEPGFLSERLAVCRGIFEEAEALLDLADVAGHEPSIAVIGERLSALIAGPAFEQEARFSPDPALLAMARLAQLIARIRGSALSAEARSEAIRDLRSLAAAIEADALDLAA